MKDVPGDYYRRLHAVEEGHWWHVGMRGVAAALLAERLRRTGQALLDAGCGTGGFLAWARGTGAFARLAGTDISPEALHLAAAAVPEADLRLAPLHDLPFESGSFDLVALNDVLQHVDEREVGAGLREVRRVTRSDGALLVRTNGGRRARRERADWRLYDEATLRRTLADARFDVERTTYANALLSGWGALRGRSPRAPTTARCGIPASTPGAFVNAVGRSVLRAEGSLLGAGGRLPYGHTLFALAVPAEHGP